jgi:hypothetical protein
VRVAMPIKANNAAVANIKALRIRIIGSLLGVAAYSHATRKRLPPPF